MLQGGETINKARGARRQAPSKKRKATRKQGRKGARTQGARHKPEGRDALGCKAQGRKDLGLNMLPTPVVAPSLTLKILQIENKRGSLDLFDTSGNERNRLGCGGIGGTALAVVAAVEVVAVVD